MISFTRVITSCLFSAAFITSALATTISDLPPLKPGVAGPKTTYQPRHADTHSNSKTHSLARRGHVSFVIATHHDRLHHSEHHLTPLHLVAKPPMRLPLPITAKTAAPAPNVPLKGSDSGLPLPRFAALRSNEVSLRAGPGTRYPIEWIYQRRLLPVEIEREFEVWRLVSEPDGTKGWVHEAMLTGRRGFLITSDQPQTLRVSASETAAPVAILKPGVVGQLLTCPTSDSWCKVAVQTYTGWLPRTAFWGALPNETIVQQ